MTNKYKKPSAEEIEKKCKELVIELQALGLYPISYSDGWKECPHCGKPIHEGTSDD